MSDIFISYTNKDRPWVERFAKVLAGLVWWYEPGNRSTQ